MRRISTCTMLIAAITVLSSSLLMASGSGHHSHGPVSSAAADKSGVVTYKDTRDGIEAYLEFNNSGPEQASEAQDFLVVCEATAYLQDAATGARLQVAKSALRATGDHGVFGETKALVPAGNGRMRTTLFIKERGEKHFLLIAVIPGLGAKEFHFHHVF